MVDRASLREGMRVFGSDNALIGTIDSLIGYEFTVDGRLIFPQSCIARVEGDSVYLPNPAAQYLAQTGPQEAEGSAPAQNGSRPPTRPA
jgi:hypothetical protein